MIPKRIETFFALALTAVLSMVASGCVKQSGRIIIVETTDVHGAILPYDFINDSPAQASLASVSFYLKSLRESGERSIVLLDGGDILQGDPSVYYYNFVETNALHLAVRAFLSLNYDACAVGNHDIETGHAVYDRLARDYDKFWISANILNVSNHEPYFMPYRIVKREGIRIAILALTTPYIPHWLPENIRSGMTFEDMVVSASNWVAYIEEHEKPDLVVGLFHAGTDWSYNRQKRDDACNENASLIVAEEVPGFNIIFTGHDHQLHNFVATNREGGTVLILGAGSKAQNVAAATVEYTRQTVNDRLDITVTGEIVPMENYPPDPAFTNRFAADFNQIDDFVSMRIGTNSHAVSAREALFGDSEFMGIIHRLQIAVSGAQISFAAPLRTDAEIAAGPITVRDLFKLYPYENLLYTMKLTGAEIDGYLEYSYANWMEDAYNASGHLIRFESVDGDYPKFAANPYNYDSASGIDYTVDLNRPAGYRVTIWQLSDGEPFDTNAEYLCAINSYRGSGGGGHLEQGAGISTNDIRARVLSSTTRDLRYYLMKQIEANGGIYPALLGEWTIEPPAWVETAVARDRKLLFGD